MRHCVVSVKVAEPHHLVETCQIRSRVKLNTDKSHASHTPVDRRGTMTYGSTRYNDRSSTQYNDPKVQQPVDPHGTTARGFTDYNNPSIHKVQRPVDPHGTTTRGSTRYNGPWIHTVQQPVD